MGSGGPWGGLAEVIAAGCGPVVKLWAPSAPQQAAKINEGTPVYCVDFSHNNRVLAVAGEKGQANLYSSKAVGGSATYTPVSCVPTTPLATVDSMTCVKFAPNDSALLGGCRNGRVHIWSLKGDEANSVMDPLIGSITSVTVNASLTTVAASSTSGHVVLGRFPTGQKMKTLLQSGPRAGCLSFAATQPSLLCGAKGSGQLVVWDITQLKEQRPEEYNVHRKIVTGCTFEPNDDNLLISCGEDGLLACTDRRSHQIAWECALQRSLASVSMRWDGSMVAVGTGDGHVLVHDTRSITTTLSTQQFSDDLPVTALCWQHMPSSKSHKSRDSLGSAAVAAGSVSAAPSSHKHVAGQGSTEAAGSRVAVSSKAAPQPAAQAAAPAARGVQASSKAASAGPHRTPLVVPGWDSTTPQSHGASSSSEVEPGMRVMSPMRMFSPLDSDIMSGLSGPTGTAAAAAAGHTPESALAQHTPAESTASGAGFRMQTVVTPALPYSSHGGNTSVTPFGGLAASGPTTSTAAAAAPAVAAPSDPPRDRKAGSGSAAAAGATTSISAAASDRRGADSSQRTSAGGAAGPLSKPVAAKATDSTVAAAAAAGGRGSKPSSTAAPGNATGTSEGGTSHRRKASDVPAAATTAVDRSSKSRPSSAAGPPDSSNVQDRTADAGKAAVVSGSGIGAGKVAAVGAAGGAAAAAQQQISSGHSGAASAFAAPAAAAAAAAAAAGGGGGVMSVTGSTLREDVFKAYIDKRMDALQQAVTDMHVDLHKRFEQAQADLAVVVTSLASRQDQLAEAVTQLTEAVQSLAVSKQQQQQQQQYTHADVSMIPWI